VSDEELLAPPGLRQRGPVPSGTRLVLIRHGECVANAEGIAGGPRGDGGLTDLGRRQVRALARRLTATGELAQAGALYSSTLPRAVESAAIVAEALRPGLRVRAQENLSEISVGDGDGLSWREFAERFATPDWDRDPHALSAPGGESLVGFYERCVAAFEELAACHPGELVVVVCHGGVIEQALKMYQGVGAATRLRPRIEHASMTELERRENGWRLLRYNDSSPLALLGL
jgi:2,3-bisphosphoglycerate-dependent phosphoglycerate mutase